jgi:alkylation response protein AidB-like acyl-CoA dehydrogenase
MEFRDSPEEAEFRAGLRRWLEAHARDTKIPDDPRERAEAQRRFHQVLYEAGYIALSFPVEFGGHGKPPTYEAILNEELAAFGAPPIEGVGHMSNALLLFGSDEQRRTLLPGILSGSTQWCQGFSEPGAGSDLAGLSTRADLVDIDGEPHYRINGQKIWTSFAATADMCFLLCRTEPDAPKHKGISILLVPMTTPGVEARRIVNAARNTEFAEVFFTDAVVPASSLLGERGQGWPIANQLLAYERGPSDVNFIARIGGYLRALELDVARGHIPDDDTTRARLAEAYVELRALQLKVQRSLTDRVSGKLPGAEGSIDKLLLTRADQCIGRAVMDLRGADSVLAEELSWDIYVWSRASAIYGGTQQIQRNIVAQRVLGLPRA